jgi:hypothetical protein
MNKQLSELLARKASHILHNENPLLINWQGHTEAGSVLATAADVSEHVRTGQHKRSHPSIQPNWPLLAKAKAGVGSAKTTTSTSRSRSASHFAHAFNAFGKDFTAQLTCHGHHGWKSDPQ